MENQSLYMCYDQFAAETADIYDMTARKGIKCVIIREAESADRYEMLTRKTDERRYDCLKRRGPQIDVIFEREKTDYWQKHRTDKLV